MTRHLPIFCAIVCLFARAAFAAAPSTNVVTATQITTNRNDYETFRIIAERNIFNANRSRGGRDRAGRGGTERATRIEAFSLLGTMSYEKGIFAFFDGTASQYRGAISPNQSIGAFKVTEITPDLVKLERNGTNYEMRVSMQMRKEDEGEWRLTQGSSLPVMGSTNSSSGDSSTGGSSTPSSSSGALSELELRLMKAREQEK